MKWGVWMISGSFSDSLNYVVLNPNPTLHSLETLKVYFSSIILSQYIFSVWNWHPILQKKQKKAHATECYIGNKSFNIRVVRMRSRYMTVCMWLWHWACPGQWSVTALVLSEVRDQTVRDKCAGNNLSLWTGYSPWQAAAETLHMSVPGNDQF